MKLDALKFGIATGIVWGVSVLLVAVIAGRTDFMLGFVTALGHYYIGEKPGLVGGLIGMIYGFFDAGIGAYLLALIYNAILKK